MLDFRHGMAARGDVDAPHRPNKQIRIRADLKDEERLEVIIHEITHAAIWDASEETVTEFSHDLARILYRHLAYRGREAGKEEGAT